jgi:hypothetical protein
MTKGSEQRVRVSVFVQVNPHSAQEVPGVLCSRLRQASRSSWR